MGKYGEAALKAVTLMHLNKVETPIDAWDTATIEIFGNGSPSQKKGCPKSTFIGLCEEGLICGVKKGRYSKNNKSKNKDYGTKAIRLLKRNLSLAEDKKLLWNLVLEGESKQHNSQMDVVITLWKNNLIKTNV